MTQGYDPLVYENTHKSRAKIFGVIMGFYAFNWLMTWGIYEFGIHLPDAYTWFAVVIFILTILGLIAMIIVGSKSNEKNNYHEFLSNKISEQEQLKAEKILKDE